MAKIFEFNGINGSLRDTVNDRVGSPVSFSGATGFRNTEKGKAIFLPGASSYVNFSTAVSLGTVFSLSCVIKVTQGAGYGAILGWNNTSYPLSVKADVDSLYCHDGSNYVSTSGAGINDGKWHHVVVTRNGTSVIFYVDTRPITTSALASNNAISIDRMGSRNSDFFYNGGIANVKVYNTVLSPQEVASLYSDFVSSQPISKPKRGFIYPKATDLKSEVDKVVGTDVASGWDFTNWTKSSGGTIVDNNTFTVATAGDGIYKVLCTVGKRYRVNIQGDMTVGAGGQFQIWNSASISNIVGVIKTDSGSFNVAFDFTAAATQLHLRMGTNTGTFNISKFTLTELSGLVAAYNMQPTGTVLTDISGNGYNFTVAGNTSGAVINQDALKLPGTAGLIRTQLAQITKDGSYTVNCRVKINNISLGVIWANGNSSADRNGLVISGAGTIAFEKYNGSAYIASSNAGILANTWYNFSCVNNAGTHTLYINGVAANSTSTLGELGNSAALFNVAIDLANGSGSRNANIDIADLKVYNRAITLAEVKDYNNQWAKQVYINECFDDQPADGTAVVPTGWTKVSGAFKIGEYQPQLGNRITNGDFASDSVWSKGTGWTISDGKANSDGSQSAESYLSQTSSILTVGKKYLVTFTVSNYVAGSIRAGSGTGTWGESLVGSGLYSKEITAYSSGLYIGVSADFVGSIDNVFVAEIDPLPNFTKGQKYLECTTAGHLALPSQWAFGTIEFDWFKGADANVYEVTFVSSDMNVRASGVTGKYGFLPSSDEAVYIVEDFNSYITRTAASYIQNNTWYRVKITRSTAGVFTTLLKGGTLVPTDGYDGFTLISVTGGSGANPSTAELTYTTSNYLLVNLKAGDRFTNLTMRFGVVV